MPLPTKDPEDRLIRNMIVITLSTAAVGILALAMIVTVMVGANFNVLQWME